MLVAEEVTVEFSIPPRVIRRVLPKIWSLLRPPALDAGHLTCWDLGILRRCLPVSCGNLFFFQLSVMPHSPLYTILRGLRFLIQLDLAYSGCAETGDQYSCSHGISSHSYLRNLTTSNHFQ
jgi:hypothetical protein